MHPPAPCLNTETLNHRSSCWSKYRNSQPPQFLLDGTPVVQPPLADSFRKSQFLLGFTIDALFLRQPSTHVLFVTLTSAKPLYSTKKGHDQLNKLVVFKP